MGVKKTVGKKRREPKWEYKKTVAVRIPGCKKLKENKKKWTPHRFLHRGPKKAVEHDSDIHFDLT